MNTLQVPSFDNTQDAAEVSPEISEATSNKNAKKKKKASLPRPTLVIPPPQVQNSPYSANINMPMTGGLTPGTKYKSGLPTAGTPQVPPYMYSRKASRFVFAQFDGIKDFTVNTAKSGLGIGEKCSFLCYNKLKTWSKKWFTHIFLIIVLVIYTVGGAYLFIYLEAHRGEIIRNDLREARTVLLKKLRNMTREIPVRLSEGEWLGSAMNLVQEYEAVVVEDAKMHDILNIDPNYKPWSFWNAIMFCGTIYTTIGYGNVTPTTITGRALTIVYAIIGIPLFLIALTDFGKLFTRCIKFLWSFIRRLYYTGSCRTVRKTAHVQEIFKGAQMMYEIATFRRPSQYNLDVEGVPDSQNDQEIRPANTEVGNDTPTTPALSNFEIDDEFNLPITVAITILVIYIFLGAVFYKIAEGYNFFDSFYFVFISMSTIGFGDFVPKRPETTIVSIIYLVFGLALMSMCINVVQVKLSDTFQHASAKIGATIGLTVTEDDGSITTVPPLPVEIPEVHGAEKKEEENGKVKEEDIRNDVKIKAKDS